MATKFGFAGLSGVVTNESNKDGLQDQINDLRKKVICGRVTEIIYDENSEGFEEEGKWNSIGTIRYEMVNYQTISKKSGGVARPLIPNIKIFPVLNEIVYLIGMPAFNQGEKTNELDYYYFPPTNIVNHPQVNPIPNQVKNTQSPDSQKKSISQISAGATSKSGDSEKELDFNGDSKGTFVERDKIHPILPFAGDVIHEGRFGNSIRLGNTAKTDSTFKNNWSVTGKTEIQ